MTDDMIKQLAAMVGCAPDELRGALYGMVYRHRKLMENKYIEDHPCIDSHRYRERDEYCSQCNRDVCGECSEDLAHTGEGDPPLICRRQACIDAYEAAQSGNEEAS